MQQKISRLEQCIANAPFYNYTYWRVSTVNSKSNSHDPQLNDCGEPSFQGANPSNPLGLPQISQGRTQVSEHFVELDGLTGHTMQLSRTPNRIENEDRNFPYWPKEFTDLWSFPGGEFGFDDLAFMQQL